MSDDKMLDIDEGPAMPKVEAKMPEEEKKVPEEEKKEDGKKKPILNRD